MRAAARPAQPIGGHEGLVDEHVVSLDDERGTVRKTTIYANTVNTRAVLYRAFVARYSLYLYGA